MSTARRQYLFIAFIVLGSGIAGCKKYEEGPAISLASKKNRLAGQWLVESATILSTGVDTIAGFEQFRLKFDKDGKFSQTVDFNQTKGGSWQFGTDETVIQTIVVADETIVDRYTIVRLKKKELKLDYEGVRLALIPD